jgi:hypothetical protein
MEPMRPQTPHRSPRQAFGGNFCKGASRRGRDKWKRAGQSTWIALASPFREYNADKHTETGAAAQGILLSLGALGRIYRSEAVIEIGIEARKGARARCPRCGVHVEHLPWASGKLRLCDAWRLFLAQWARLLSWQEVGEHQEVGGHAARAASVTVSVRPRCRLSDLHDVLRGRYPPPTF